MIIGILPNTSSTETLLNNLSEADFDLGDVSVVLRDLKLREAIAQDAGPLKGVTPATLGGRLLQAGLSEAGVKPYCDAVAEGKVLVAIQPPPGAEKAAAEMLQDASAQLIIGTPDHENKQTPK
jgi:hypothetical protein